MADEQERWFKSYLPTSMAGSCYDSLVPIFVVLVLCGDVGDAALVSLMASAATVPSLIFWGMATDSQKHRKSFVVLGFMGRAVAYIMMAASTGIPSLAVAHIVIGLLSAASAPAMATLILEHFTKDRWSEKIGAFNKVSGVGNMLGLVMGIAWIAFVPSLLGMEAALRLLFILNALLALTGAWLAHILIVEPLWKIDRTRMFSPMVELVRWSREKARYLPGRISHYIRPAHLKMLWQNHRPNDQTGRYLVSTFIYNTGINAFFTIIPICMLVELGYDGSMIFVFSLILISVSTFMYAPVGRMMDRANRSRMLSYSVLARTLMILICGTVLYFGFFDAWAITAFFIIIYLLLGLTWAVIADTQLPIYAALCPSSHQGARAGVFNAVVGLGHIAGDAAGGILALKYGFSGALLICSSIILASAFLYMTVGVSGNASSVPLAEPLP